MADFGNFIIGELELLHMEERLGHPDYNFAEPVFFSKSRQIFKGDGLVQRATSGARAPEFNQMRSHAHTFADILGQRADISAR